jgi:type VI secretion system protein ImpA
MDRMAAIDFAMLAAPVSDEAPCGPDLELDGDPDYMNFMARTEGLLPVTFFSGPEGKPFDRTSIDFEAELASMAPLLERTRDVRLLALLAKLLVLNRNLAGFAGSLSTIEALLKAQWDGVHPRATDGDFAIRMAALESLDDMPPVVFPMQYMPLVNHRRLGPLSYRSWMIATGETKAREGETVLDPAAIEAAMLEVELPELVETRDQFMALQAMLRSIRDICLEHAGGERAAKLEKLPGLVDKILVLVNDIVVRRDPSLAMGDDQSAGGAEDAGASTVPAGAVASTRAVAEALSAVADYFARCEPSNPALLLVRQAEQLMGKSFLEVMRVLVPNHMEHAAIQIGKDQQVFDLPVMQLSEFAQTPQTNGADHPEDQEEAPSDDEASSGDDQPPADQASTDQGSAEDQEHRPVEVPRERAPRRLEAKTRDDAIRLLEQIGAFYRSAEPSSPVPFLTERARSFAQRDFISLLKDVLPEGALKGSAN